MKRLQGCLLVLYLDVKFHDYEDTEELPLEKIGKYLSSDVDQNKHIQENCES